MGTAPMTRVLRYAGANHSLLAHNQANSFAAGYALSFYAGEAVYSFIPKNACSTMRYSLALANGAIETPAQVNWIHNNNTTFRATLAELARAKYSFVILRNPFLRLASCFFDKFVDQTPVAYAFHRLRNYESSPHALTFRDFVTQLKPHLRGNEHWRPQIDFLVYKSYDAVFALEDFPFAVNTLREKIGLEVHDARALTKHGADQLEPLADENCVADVSAFDLLALKRAGKAPALARFYDGALAKLAGALYAEDVALYRDWTGRGPVF